MIRSTLGAPLGGTTLGGQPGLESAAVRLILPVKGGGGFGMYFPSMVVVAPGAPSGGTVAGAAALAGCAAFPCAAFGCAAFCWASVRVEGAAANSATIAPASPTPSRSL